MQQLKFSNSTIHTMIKGILKGVDDSYDDTIYKAVQSSKEVHLAYLYDETYQTKLLVMLEKLGKKDHGFTYNLSFDVNGKINWI